MHISSHQVLKITKAGFHAVDKISMPIQDRLLLSETKKAIYVKDLYTFSKRSPLEFQSMIQQFYLSGWLKIYEKMEEASQAETEPSSVDVDVDTASTSETQTLKDNDLDFTSDLGNILSQIQKAQDDLKKLNDEQNFLRTEITKTQALTKPTIQKTAGEKTQSPATPPSEEELSFLDDLDLEQSKKEAEEDKVREDEENKETQANEVVEPSNLVVIGIEEISLEEQMQQQQLNRQKERALREQLAILQRMQKDAELQKERNAASIAKRKQKEEDKKQAEEKKKQELLERQKKLNQDRLKTASGLSAYLKKMEQEKKK